MLPSLVLLSRSSLTLVERKVFPDMDKFSDGIEGCLNGIRRVQRFIEGDNCESACVRLPCVGLRHSVDIPGVCASGLPPPEKPPRYHDSCCPPTYSHYSRQDCSPTIRMLTISIKRRRTLWLRTSVKRGTLLSTCVRTFPRKYC